MRRAELERVVAAMTDEALVSFVCIVFACICVLIVLSVKLGKILPQTTITVPEVNREALGVSQVALRSK